MVATPPPGSADVVVETAAAAMPAKAQPILPPAHDVPAPELVATAACLSPEDVADKDGDFKRNAASLSGNGFCIAEETFKERSVPGWCRR